MTWTLKSLSGEAGRKKDRRQTGTNRDFLRGAAILKPNVCQGRLGTNIELV